MFGELPKVLDTKFLIGYFLPCTVFTAINLFIIISYGLISFPENLVKDNPFGFSTVLVFSTWLISVVFLAANRSIYMLYEGYGGYNPLKIFWKFEKKRFDLLTEKYQALTRQIGDLVSTGGDVPTDLLDQKDALRLKLVEEFPDKRQWVLPTRLGNCIRAFEIYPRDMYGIDDIPGWNRLITVIPKDYLEMVNDAKAQTDFWINLSFISFLSVIPYLVISFCCKRLMIPWLLPTLCFTGLYCLKRGRVAVIDWGDMVKAAYDVFLSDLLKKLQFPPPSTIEEERCLWSKFSTAIIYRRPGKVPSRDVTSAKPIPPQNNKKLVFLGLIFLLPSVVRYFRSKK